VSKAWREVGDGLSVAKNWLVYAQKRPVFAGMFLANPEAVAPAPIASTTAGPQQSFIAELAIPTAIVAISR